MSGGDVLSRVFRATGGALLHEFLAVQLARSMRYRRAVGYFSSSVFAVGNDAFVEYFRRGGSIELVCSPVFSRGDIYALYQGTYNAREWGMRDLDYILSLPKSSFSTAMLSWALGNRRLDIRVAELQSTNSHAIYHEKIGVFTLRCGNLVGFEGSANESSNGYVGNFERITAYDAWTSDSHTQESRRLSEQFELLWTSNTPGLVVHTLHDAFRTGILRIREESRVTLPSESSPPPEPLPSSPPELLQRPSRLELRDYQENAILSWFMAKGKGIYSMATGTGKTITALSTIEELYRRCGPPLAVIIVAPYLNLVEQWKGVAKRFGLDPILCCGARSEWVGSVEAATFLVNSGRRPLLSLITTNATFAESAFQAAIQRLQVRTVIIADEVHNLGARNLQSSLPERVQLRLGLSATPERWMDEDGTRAVQAYFGKTVFNLDLAEAIKLEPPVLTPYSYHPVLISLEEDEQEEYLQITKQLARYIVSPRTENLSDVVLGLLLKRARIVACARRKLSALATAIAPYRTTRYNLIYCGDGQVEVESTSAIAARSVPEVEVKRQVDAVARLLGTEFGMNVGIYTSDVTTERRGIILEEFEKGEKNALIAIRCLDEGIDIPNVRRAFILASSTNPRQFIQRRGRVLRRADGKDLAEIFDFVVVPPFDAFKPGSSEYKVMRNLVTKEMARVTEFAKLAVNGPQAYAKLQPILSSLRLMHL